MAFESPIYKAPAIPKISSRNISSSVIRGAQAVSTAATPRLRRSSFSFLQRPKLQGTQESLKLETNQVDALQETNRILVEIQKQLSLDFASRITEKKQSLGSLRASMLKKRAAQKEKAIESVNNDAGIIKGAFDKITAPAKGIFDRIIEFVSTIATGFVVNAAFGWLSDKKNRQKLLETFEFLTKHWKWLVGIFIGAKLVGAIIKIISLVRRLKGLIELIRKVWGKPPKPPSTGGGGKGGGGGGLPGGGLPGGGCGPVLDCLKNMSAADVENLAKRIIATKTFSPLLGAPSPIFSPTTKPTTAPPVFPVFPTPGLTQPAPVNPLTLPTPTQPPSLPQTTPRTTQPQGKPWWQTALDVGGILVDIASIAGIVLTLLPLIPGADDAVGVGLAGRLAAKYGSKARPTAAPGARNPKPKINVTVNDPFSKAVESLRKRNYSYSDLRTILNDPKTSAFDKKAAEKILTEAGQRTFSGGGTVGGTGPGNVDSVPAMLAPGEEVIRTSSANLFRPLLKDINDNAGTMWVSFKEAIQEQEKNNARQASINGEFSSQINAFNKELEGLINQEKQKKIKESEKKSNSPRVSNVPPAEGTGKGGPSDTQKPPASPSLPTTTPSKEMGKSIPSGEDRNKVSPQTSPTPGPSPTSSSPSSSPTPAPIPTTGPQRIPVEPYNPSTPQLSSVKPIQKSYSFNTLKPESGSKIAMLSYPMPPITMKQSSGQRNVSEATPPPTAKTTNSLDGYISLAAMEYGILT